MTNNDLQKFDQLKADVTKFVGPAMQIAVADNDSMTIAHDYVQQVKRLMKAIDTKRKDLVAPLKDQAKVIDTYAKNMTEPLLQAEAHIKSALVGYENKLERDRREAQRKADAEAEAERKRIAEAEAQQAKERAKEDEAAALFGAEPEAPSVEQQTKQAEIERDKFLVEEQARATTKAIAQNRVSGTRKVWSFDVIDASQVPREFLEVNLSAIRRAVAAGAREIPGVRVFEETKIAIRA